MADPLSVAASVAGLLTAAQLVSVGIGKIVSSHKTGSREIKDIKTIVDTLRSVLLQLQMLLLSRASVDPKRASMIMVDEVIATLTACVMTFSDLDGCVKGLQADEQLGLLDSVKWVSKASELAGYLRNLESHKTSLILMTNILTCQSAHNAESAAGELKVLMLSVIQTNQQLAQRMATMERSMAPSTIGGNENDSSSIFSQETVQNATVTASTNPNVHPAFGFAFEEDLQTSWVYKRSRARDSSRPFSIGSSAQLTQSWSILSGLSLSQISNIAVQALPIFEKDIQNSSLYSFGDAEKGTGSTLEQKPLLAVRPQKHKRSVSGGWGSQIRSRLTQSGPNLTLTKRAGANVETITLPRGLRLLGRDLSTNKKNLNKEDISNPVFIYSTSDRLKNSDELMTHLSQPTPRPLPKSPESSVSPDRPIRSDPPILGVASYSIPIGRSHSHIGTSGGRSELLPSLTRPDSPVEEALQDYGLFHSALNLLDEHGNGEYLRSSRKNYSTGSYKVLYLAASLFEFNLSEEKREAGYPYLTYQAGEIFDVIAEKGELWLSKNQDDPTDTVGWLWSKHFARLTWDESKDEQDGRSTPVPLTESRNRKGKMVARRDDGLEDSTVNQNKSGDEQGNPVSTPIIKSNQSWDTITTLDEISRLGEEVVQSDYLKKEYDQFDFRFK